MLYASGDGGIQIVYLIQTGFKLQGQWLETIIWQLMQSSFQEKKKERKTTYQSALHYNKGTEKMLEGKYWSLYINSKWSVFNGLMTKNVRFK